MAKSKQLNWILVILLITVVASGLYWVNYQFAKNNPGGNDFLAYYVGTRALIFERVSPYSDDVALEIQNSVFGRSAQEGEIDCRVVYPIYSTLIFAPFALIGDYVAARSAWMLFLEIALAVTAYLAVNLFVWKPKLGMLGFYYFFSIFWYHGFRSLINGNAVIVVGLLITGTLYAIKVGKDNIAGILLAFSTIKPNLVVLIMIFIFIWCIYQKRTQVILWFIGTMAILILGGMLVIPDWIMQNLWEILKYTANKPAGSIAEVIGGWVPEFQSIVKWTIGIGLGMLLIYEWWIARKQNYNWFLWTVCLTLVISQWIGIQTDSGNFVILFTPFVIVLAFLDNRWNKHGTVATFSTMVLVLVGLWVLFVATLDFDYQPMQSSVMFFPFPGLVLIGLYWTRWWATGTKTALWSDTV